MITLDDLREGFEEHPVIRGWRAIKVGGIALIVALGWFGCFEPDPAEVAAEARAREEQARRLETHRTLAGPRRPTLERAPAHPAAPRRPRARR